MGTITIRRLDDDVIAQLKDKAKQSGRSMEEEARMVLTRSVSRKLRDRPLLIIFSKLREQMSVIARSRIRRKFFTRFARRIRPARTRTTNRVVVDASVALKWRFRETDSHLAERLLFTEALLAPTIPQIEMRYVIARLVRQRAISAAEARGPWLTQLKAASR